MKSMNPYLTFAGQCRDALNTYQKIFGGTIVSMQTYGESNMADAGGADKDAVIHSEFQAEGMHFMASDDMRGFQPHSDNNITLSLDLSDLQEQDRIYNALAEGGTATYPLADTFWGARFGQVTDKFGIQWMLNCQKQ